MLLNRTGEEEICTSLFDTRLIRTAGAIRNVAVRHSAYVPIWYSFYLFMNSGFATCASQARLSVSYV